MKTAQEWYVNLLGRPDMGWNVDLTQQEYHDHIKEVQLDAMKEGIRRAAKAVHNPATLRFPDCVIEGDLIRAQLREIADKLTLKDL